MIATSSTNDNIRASNVRAVAHVGASLRCRRSDRNRSQLILRAANALACRSSPKLLSLMDKHSELQFDHTFVDERGLTALHHAVVNSDAAFVAGVAARAPRLLNVLDNECNSPVLLAARYNRVDSMRELLALNANPNLGDADGRTALHVAAATVNVAMLQLLLSAGAFVGVVDKSGAAPLHFLAASRVGADQNVAEALASCLKALTERGADANARDECGDTPLHWAARETTDVALRTFLDNSAVDASIRNIDGESASDIARVSHRAAELAGDADAVERAARVAALLTDAEQRIAQQTAKKPTLM